MSDSLAPRKPLVPAWSATIGRGRPGFASIEPVLAQFAAFAAWPEVAAYNEPWRGREPMTAAGAPLQFVEQRPLGRRKKRELQRAQRKAGVIDPAGRYEAKIHLAGEIPTRRSSWHDFFNMAVWQTLPVAKQNLNTRGYEATIAHIDEACQGGVLTNRSRGHDALAMFDEGGLVLVTTDEFASELSAVVKAPSVEDKIAWLSGRPVRYFIFGHAIYELLVKGPAPILAMAVVLAAGEEFFADALSHASRLAVVDELLGRRLADPAEFHSPAQYGSMPIETLLAVGREL